MVARGVDPSEVYPAAVAELSRGLGIDNVALLQYETDQALVMLATRDERGLTRLLIGERLSLEGDNVAAMILDTGQPAWMDSLDGARGRTAERVRRLGLLSAIGAPIIVDGRTWGALVIGSSQAEPLPPETETRIGDFADLVATAISNAETRAELTASRARIVTAGDQARRRFERDLHDGAQQRIVSLGLELRAAEAAIPEEQQQLRDQVSHVVDGLVGVSQRNCKRYLEASTRPSCRRAGLVRRSRRLRDVPPSQSSWTSTSIAGCPNLLKSRPITSSPRR